jgi:hypothetical protein
MHPNRGKRDAENGTAVRLRIPHPIRKHRTERDNVTRRLLYDIVHDIRDRPLTIKHVTVVKHEPRPPAPVPIRLQIVWIMQDGQELRQYINMYGQSSTTDMIPNWVLQSGGAPNWPPTAMRFEFQYENGNRI